MTAADAALNGEQGGDPLHGLKRSRRGNGMVHVIEFAAHMAPAGHLEQRRVVARPRRLVEFAEPGVAICVQEASAGTGQCLGMHSLRSGE